MSTGGPLVCLFGPYFFQNEYSKPLPGPKFEYWPFESIPLDIIMRVLQVVVTVSWHVSIVQNNVWVRLFEMICLVPHGFCMYTPIIPSTEIYLFKVLFTYHPVLAFVALHKATIAVDTLAVD